MKTSRFVILGIVVLAVGIYWLVAQQSQPALQQQASPALPTDVKQVVEQLSSGILPARSASIDARQLTLISGDDAQNVFALPAESFFVSIAPYLQDTHPCAIHNLAGCQGELAGEAFAVYVVDDTGRVLVDEQMLSHPNGFIDLWLPRDQSFKISITQDGRSADAVISSFDEDPTCITTMQLS
ncbi:CueP family metal-binding protein [Paenibacillus daejeonensis]|uniref:CueP family metal-binding protein n=1 Tax=Paenibacillus daejeonensis TaxID=135193 RepID=UPI00036E7A53|nr:CueP family metal-binding protein [Paenibacillus daejeonensis]